MTESMLERVARAIYETEPFGTTAHGHPIAWSSVAESQKDGFLLKARAAVEAVREPTDAVLNAGYEAEPTGAAILPSWEAMIDAILAGMV